MSESEYYFIDHGEADTTPTGSKLDNIIGLELEVSEFEDYEELDNLIYNEYIQADGTSWAPILIESEAQGDVEAELIFRADTPDIILERLSNICHIRRDTYTAYNTSAHIHLNRKYISGLGLAEIDIYKAVEMLAPLIYHLSGRSHTSWEEWTPSNIDIDLPIMDRIKLLDKVRPKNTGNYSDRYELCNCTNSSTIEIRGFSNYCNFNYNTIKTFIKIASQLVFELADAMKGKQYSENWRLAFNVINTFLNNNSIVFNAYNISSIIQDKERNIQDATNKFNTIINYLNDATGSSTLYACDKIIKALAYEPQLELEVINLKDIESDILNLREQAQKIFLNKINKIGGF